MFYLFCRKVIYIFLTNTHTVTNLFHSSMEDVFYAKPYKTHVLSAFVTLRDNIPDNCHDPGISRSKVTRDNTYMVVISTGSNEWTTSACWGCQIDTLLELIFYCLLLEKALWHAVQDIIEWCFCFFLLIYIWLLLHYFFSCLCCNCNSLNQKFCRRYMYCEKNIIYLLSQSKNV